jgi:hypothetical protein
MERFGRCEAIELREVKYETDEEKRQATPKALLEYCGLDTLAMAKILEKLGRIAKPEKIR